MAVRRACSGQRSDQACATGGNQMKKMKIKIDMNNETDSGHARKPVTGFKFYYIPLIVPLIAFCEWFVWLFGGGIPAWIYNFYLSLRGLPNELVYNALGKDGECISILLIASGMTAINIALCLACRKLFRKNIYMEMLLAHVLDATLLLIDSLSIHIGYRLDGFEEAVTKPVWLASLLFFVFSVIIFFVDKTRKRR
jgi:hypothetical protein